MPNEQRHYSNELNLESVGINLPYNMQAEQSVLGAVLLKPETLTDLVEIIRPEMFYTRQNAQIYSEMLRLFTADQTIDFVTLLDAVISDGVFPSADEAKVYLTGLAETVPSISNVKAYAQIVQEKYLVRQLMGVAKDILQDAGDEPDADLLLENAEQRIYEIRSGRDSSALLDLQPASSHRRYRAGCSSLPDSGARSASGHCPKLPPAEWFHLRPHWQPVLPGHSAASAGQTRRLPAG